MPTWQWLQEKCWQILNICIAKQKGMHDRVHVTTAYMNFNELRNAT